MADEIAPYRQYTQSLLVNTGYRATWTPAEYVELGSVGFITEGVFENWTDLENLGISLGRTKKSGIEDFDYQSSKGVSMKTKVAGETSAHFEAIAKAGAGVRFDFSRSGAVVFSAPNCQISEISDKQSLQRKLRNVDDWEIDWIVVTKVVRAPTATILVSGNSGAWVELRTHADISPGGVEIAELAADFSLARSSEMSVKVVAKGDLTPLYQAHRMYQPPLTRDRNKRELRPYRAN